MKTSDVLSDVMKSDAASEVLKDVAGSVLGEEERKIIEDYYKAQSDKDDKEKKKSKAKDKKGSKKFPPGLAKKEQLPPGLAKQIEKNGKLPPGLEKRDLPDELESKLPKTAKHTERAVVGNDIVLIEKGTDIVLDVMKDVLSSQ